MRDQSQGRGGRDARSSFNRETRSDLIRNADKAMSTGKMFRILQAADETRQTVINHHEKYARKWEEQRYGDLLKKGTQRPVLTPGWTREDPTAGYRAKARMEVSAKKEARLARVDRAHRNMLQNGQLRATRRVGWDRGLGE